MYSVFHRTWKFLNGAHNPVWLTMLLPFVITVVSLGLGTNIQQSQKVQQEYETVFRDYIAAVTEYTHQLYMVAGSLQEYSLYFEDWYTSLTGGASPETVNHLVEAVTKSENTYIKDDTDLGRLILNVKAAEGQLLTIAKDTSILKVLENSPRNIVAHVDYLVITDTYQNATADYKAELTSGIKDIGSKMTAALEKLSSAYRTEYEKAYRVLKGALEQQ